MENGNTVVEINKDKGESHGEVVHLPFFFYKYYHLPVHYRLFTDDLPVDYHLPFIT